MKLHTLRELLDRPGVVAILEKFVTGEFEGVSLGGVSVGTVRRGRGRSVLVDSVGVGGGSLGVHVHGAAGTR